MTQLAMTTTPVSFPVFLVMWNRQQGRNTPALHLKMARWLEAGGQKAENAMLLLMAFRGAGKSTVAGLFCAWSLYRNPDLRILVLAADDALAARMVRNVRRVIERHILTLPLRPQKADQWAADRFTVERSAELRDPSMRAAGISANITGSRADLVICDDVEVPNTCDSAEKRIILRERLSEIDYILNPGGAILAIGTPHAFETIYADETTAGFARLEIPILDTEGTSAWPEKFSTARIENIRARSGPRKFASQMMLRPMSSNEGRLNPDLFGIYDGELIWNREIGGLYVEGCRLLAASAWWDPAFGAAKGDHSVLACAFRDENNDMRIQKVEYIRIPSATITTESDEATAQCRIVARIARDLYLPAIAVETNGLGRFLPAILRRMLVEVNASCTVLEIANRKPKDLRILESLDAPMAAQKIKLHRSVLDTPLLSELRDWKPGTSKGHDDGIDALAGALSLHFSWIERSPATPGRRHDWRPGTHPGKARTEFKV